MRHQGAKDDGTSYNSQTIMVSDTYHIVVVGAGPAGAATALLAARAGRRVALVDAAHFPRQKVCGEYLSAAGRQLLEDWGLGELSRAAAPLDALRLVAGRQSLEMPFDGRRLGPASLSRFALDSRLVEAAVAAGAALFDGRRLREVIVAAGRVEGVELVEVADPSSLLRLSSPLVVAADGRRSQVVRQTGKLRQGHGGLIGYKRHVPHFDRSRFDRRIVLHSHAGGYVGVCPVEDGSINVCGLMPRDVLREARGNVTAALRRWSGDEDLLPLLDAAERANAEPWHTVPEVAWQTATPTVEGVLYVGDAMGTIEPLTGQGMTMALGAAELAARQLAAVGDRPVDRAVQREYEARWHAAFDRSVWAARWFGRLLLRPRLLASILAAGKLWPGQSDRLVRSLHERTLTLRTV